MSDPVELAFLDAYAAGVFVVDVRRQRRTRSGDREPLSPWVMTVAASTQTREFASTLTLTADSGDTSPSTAPRSPPAPAPLPVVDGRRPAVQRRAVRAPGTAGTFTGKIVVCDRGGGIGRVDKGYNVRQGGAAGMILYNPTLADMETDNHWLPTIHVADGTELLAFLAAHTGVTGAFTAGAAAQRPGRRHGGVLLARSGGPVHQARHHRAGRADPGRR